MLPETLRHLSLLIVPAVCDLIRHFTPSIDRRQNEGILDLLEEVCLTWNFRTVSVGALDSSRTAMYRYLYMHF